MTTQLYTLLVRGTRFDAIKGAQQNGCKPLDVVDATDESCLVLVEAINENRLAAWLNKAGADKPGALLWLQHGDALALTRADCSEHDCNNCCGHCNGAK